MRDRDRGEKDNSLKLKYYIFECVRFFWCQFVSVSIYTYGVPCWIQILLSTMLWTGVIFTTQENANDVCVKKRGTRTQRLESGEFILVYLIFFFLYKRRAKL